MANRVSRHNALALAAILAVALNLRIGVTEVGPLLDRIRAATGMSATVAGALGTIPFACMGVFALVGVRLVVRVRARWLVTACLVLLIAGTVGRAVAPSAALVLLATIPIGIAIALIGLVLPVVVRGCFPRRTGAAMGTYVAALSVGAALAALTMVPLATDLAGWRAAFAISALPTLLSLPLWLLLAPRATGRQPATMPDETVAPARAMPDRTSPRRRRLPPRNGVLLAGVFGFQSMCFAAVTIWIAALYHHDGWSSGEAAFTTALVSILVIPAALVVPGLSDHGDRRRWVLMTALIMAGGMVGFAFAPTALPWLWILAFGVGNGALFPLTLTLPQEIAGDDRGRTELTAWMLGLGYLVSATGPLIVGGLFDLTGGFVLPMALLSFLGMVAGVLALDPALKRRPVAPAPVTTG